MTCFFSDRRLHTRCALVTGVQTCALPISVGRLLGRDAAREDVLLRRVPGILQHLALGDDVQQVGVDREGRLADRQSDGWGKSVSVRVDLGGGRLITKNITRITQWKALEIYHTAVRCSLHKINNT